MIRNNIDIIGIASEDQLPKEINGQIMEYSDVENIFLPGDKSEIQDIFQIKIDLVTKDHRVVRAPLGTVIIVDGIKKFRMIYSDPGSAEKAHIANVQVPYNTFFELPVHIQEIDKVDIYIMDAYFDVIDTRRLYSHIVYLVDIQYRDPREQYESSKSNLTVKQIAAFHETSSKHQTYNEQILQETSISKESGTGTGYPSKNELLDIDAEYL